MVWNVGKHSSLSSILHLSSRANVSLTAYLATTHDAYLHHCLHANSRDTERLALLAMKARCFWEGVIHFLPIFHI